MKKALAERMLNAEMDVHLANEAESGVANHRNGSSDKTVLTPEGAMELSIPRDRHGRFDPALIGKYRRRFPGFDDKIIALYARGMSTRDIQAHVRELYGIDISRIWSPRSPIRCSMRSMRGRAGRWKRATRSCSSMRYG